MEIEVFFDLLLKEIKLNDDLSQYYKFHASDRRFKFRKAYFVQRLQYIIDHMPKNKTVKVFDLGCGYGTTALFLALNGYRVEGITLEFYFKTIKKRMRVDAISNELSEKQQNFIKKIIGRPMRVNAKQWINFSRITFVHKTQKERLTVDVNLTFENSNEKGDMKHIVIAEVKQERMSRSSDFMRIAKEMHILPIRISKYCLTTLALNPKLKKNRFKKKVLFINKLKQT